MILQSVSPGQLSKLAWGPTDAINTKRPTTNIFMMSRSKEIRFAPRGYKRACSQPALCVRPSGGWQLHQRRTYKLLHHYHQCADAEKRKESNRPNSKKDQKCIRIVSVQMLRREGRATDQLQTTKSRIARPAGVQWILADLST